MERPDPRQLVNDLFRRLRRDEFNLGVGELLDALRLVEAGWSADRLRLDLRLLWCHSAAQYETFDEAWQRASPAAAPAAGAAPDHPVSPPEAQPPERREDSPAPPPEIGMPAAPVAAEPSILPARVFTPPGDEARGPVNTYWPISRETMAYGWRSLWNPQTDGPLDLLDVVATVERAARQGFFLDAVYRRRPVSRAHLLLLVDQGGSMVPFHRFTRDLVETANDERTPARVEVYHFHNHFAGSLYRDPHLTEPVDCADALAEADAETSVLVVSDAGAARGYRRRERIRAAAAMIAAIESRSHRVAWLNPMPRDRWQATSAEVIAHLALMFQMDADGFGSAMDAARGLTAPWTPRAA